MPIEQWAGKCTFNEPGYCYPASSTLVKAGRYSLVATYSGNYLGSTSPAVTLTVKPYPASATAAPSPDTGAGVAVMSDSR
ncbi:MAG TPA: hypothetical protein VI365_28820 [Trebonia sp.]